MFIHILSGPYELPLNLGSTLINSDKMSSEFFTQKMCVLLDEAQTSDIKYKYLDSAAMDTNLLYTTEGPYAICAALQE